jgi:hypothetical protein
MKTAVSIPDPLFREAERLAKRLRIPRSQFYARALEAHIERQRAKGVKDALDEVYGTESSELDPLMARLQAMTFHPEEW